jgi:uncharacterized cupredoxin-like copper-binding protein
MIALITAATFAQEKGNAMTTTMTPARALAAVSLLALLLLTGCGGPGGVTANLTDTSIQVAPNTVTSGDITFHIKNTSATAMHEFVIVQTDLSPEQLPMDADGNVAEDKLSSPGEKGDIAAGQSADLTLNLPAGHYMLICNLPQHFKEGMHTSFTVTP